MVLPFARGREVFLSAQALDGEGPEAVFQRVARALDDAGATPVCQQVFGFPADTGRTALDQALGAPHWPVTWLDGPPDSPCAGTEVWAVSGTTVQALSLGDAVVGAVFDGQAGRVCRLGGLLPPDPDAPPTQQADAVLHAMEALLHAAGMDFGHTLRTWFHNRDILSWYGPFNGVRDAFFRQRRVFDGLVPASTGVGGEPPRGTALTAGLLAVQSWHEDSTIRPLPSPLQCPALDYGSSFSRAVELVCPTHRRIYVSGTASIEPGGDTVYTGDLARQTDRTLEVVRAILTSRDMDWDDTVRAIAYVKHTGDVPAAQAQLEAAGLTRLPLVVAQNDICRDDLLFELELDAIALR